MVASNGRGGIGEPRQGAVRKVARIARRLQPIELLRGAGYVLLCWGLQFSAAIIASRCRRDQSPFAVPWWVVAVLIASVPALLAGALSGRHGSPRGGTRARLWMGLAAALGPLAATVCVSLLLLNQAASVTVTARGVLQNLAGASLTVAGFVAGGLVGECARRQEEARAAAGRPGPADEADRPA